MSDLNDPLVDTALAGEGTIPKARNPKKIFMGSAMQDSMRKETSNFWSSIRAGMIPDYKFVTLRLSGYGLPKCRNVLTWVARQTDCGRIMMVDSDMNPRLEDVVRLLSHDVELVSGCYPQKRFDKLSWVGNFSGPAGPNGLAPAYDFGGGFCSISLDFIDKMVEHYPETAFESEDDPWRGKIMHDLWSNGPVTDEWHGRKYSRYLTEDYYLCYRARKMGVTPWMDSGCQVGHVGSIDYLQLWMGVKVLENQSIFRAPTD
jgi:hypothetical protein